VSFSREFVALALQFAHHVERIKLIPLGEVLLQFTPLYLSFGLRKDFDPRHPIWQAFVGGLTPHQDFVDWTYTFHREQQIHARPQVVDLASTFGCFYYALWPETRVRLHFANLEMACYSPLSRERRPQRHAELAAMFRHLRNVLPATATVIGGSWLYNVEAYRRLFPPKFLATSRVGAAEYQFMAQWGQFLDRHGDVRPMMARTFLGRLTHQSTEDGLPDCFPYRVLRLEAPIDFFYEFYGVA
jgi:hypothetical protein